MLLKTLKGKLGAVFFLGILILSVCSTSTDREFKTVGDESVEMFFLATVLVGIPYLIRRQLRDRHPQS